MKNCTRTRRTAAFAGLALVLAVMGGCKKEDMPKLPVVKGKVVFKDGDVARLVGNFVQFESVGDPNLRASGEIEEGGSFVMGSRVQDRMVGGVPEGEYRARIALPAGEGEQSKPRAIVHPRYLDFKTSGLQYKVGPGQNLITVGVAKKS
jgi:hypothetical protein